MANQDVDDIHEYLLLKGVDAVSIHGGKEQDERNEAIRLFKVRVGRSTATTRIMSWSSSRIRYSMHVVYTRD